MLDRVIDSMIDKFGDDVVDIFEKKDVPTLYVKSNQIEDILLYLKDEFSFEMLIDLFAVDDDKTFGVIYHLRSLKNNSDVRIKTTVPREEPSINSVTKIWKNANWLEREAYDGYGIIFKNHPKLTRVYNQDEFTGFPMRKDYPVSKRPS